MSLFTQAIMSLVQNLNKKLGQRSTVALSEQKLNILLDAVEVKP